VVFIEIVRLTVVVKSVNVARRIWRREEAPKISLLVKLVSKVLFIVIV
jgi:hypothetical protein